MGGWDRTVDSLPSPAAKNAPLPVLTGFNGGHDVDFSLMAADGIVLLAHLQGAGLAITITEACPHIKGTAIDLPQVTPIAEKIVKEQDATDRLKVFAGNILEGPLPGRYDVAVLRAILQVFSAKDPALAVKNIGAAVRPNGKIYIIGQILDDSRISPAEAVGFNLNQINHYPAGEAYTESEHRRCLTDAGFVDIECADFLLADGSGLMTARKPS